MVAGRLLLTAHRSRWRKPQEREDTTGPRRVVTFDLFSALVDSRAGGAAVLQAVAESRGWPVTGEEVYDTWDARNKQAQRRCREWVPYADLARTAMTQAYTDLDVDGDVEADVAALLGSLPEWPLWPDVHEGLAALGARYRLGVLSNVDDALLARTRAAPLVESALSLTSERLRAYKPDARIYHRAQAAVGPMVHVASSARDVRGALEAGVPVVRLRRTGHHLDPEGPAPGHEVAGVRELLDVLPVVV